MQHAEYLCFVYTRYSYPMNVPLTPQKIVVNLDSVLFCTLYVIGGIIVNAVSTPLFLIPALPMLLVFLAVQRFYIASCR